MSKVYADRVVIRQGVVSSSNAKSIDLQTEDDALGEPLNITKVKALAVHHVAPPAGVQSNNKPIRVGGGTTTPWTALYAAADDIIIIPSGGMFLLVAPTEAGFAKALWNCGNLAASAPARSPAVAREISNGLWAPVSPTCGCSTTRTGRP